MNGGKAIYPIPIIEIREPQWFINIIDTPDSMYRLVLTLFLFYNFIFAIDQSATAAYCAAALRLWYHN